MIAFCLASGASLNQEDVDFIKGKGRVYAVNDSYRLAPWADVLYAADAAWWDWHIGNLSDFKGEKRSPDFATCKKYNLSYVQIDMSAAWGEGGRVAHGGNSGFQALNMAVNDGAHAVYLLGYDMGYTDKKHWFGDHPKKLDRSSDYKKWIENIKKAVPHIPVPVYNCSEMSAIDCFSKVDLREHLR